jgi:hypothetical protein
MPNFFHVARNTFRESVREPIFFVLLMASLILIGLFPSLSLFVFREQIKLVVDSSMATTLLMGLIAATLSSSHTVSREMSNGTVLLLLSKPVKRWTFILAKIGGIIAAMTVFVLLCNAASLVSLRVAKDQFQLDFQALYGYYGLLFLGCLIGAARNYFAKVSFSASAIHSLLVILPGWIVILCMIPINETDPPIQFEVIPALTLLFFAVWLMASITVMLATRLQMVPNLIISSVIFMFGLISNYLVGRHVEQGFFWKLLYALVPNWQYFWMADALAGKQTIPLAYLGWAFLYALLQMAVCATFAILLFQEREVASDIGS